jgi:hypothetical protein
VADKSTNVGYFANNTTDMATPGTALSCYRWDPNATSTGLGTLNMHNNICIPNGGTGSFSVTTINGAATNYTMNPPENTNYGFIPANKYSPSSADPNTTGTGTNLTSFCTGSLAALCQDASGTPWFGGAPKNRPTGSTGWDKGAFQGQGGSGGPPASSVTAPANGATISTSSVSLTATCTPQSPATVASIQFFVDGTSFGSHGTSSPYTTTLDSTKIANGTNNLTVYAVCTDSNAQTGTSGIITVSVSNSTPGCTTSSPSAIFSQALTNQTSTFTATWTETPNSAANDTDFGLSPVAATGYTSMSSLLLADNSGVWLAWNNMVPGYAAVNSAPYAAGTVYSFSGTFTFSAGTLASYSISETSPSSIVIASGYTPRASATGLAYWNLISDQGLYDTVQLCGFQVGAGTSLSFSPSSLNFGSVSIGSTPSQMISVSSSGGATTFTSATLTGSSDFSKTNTCSGSQTTCSTTVQYAPSTTGPASATLTYVDSATGSPQTVPITGTGIPTASSATPSPTSVNLGNVQLGLPGGFVSGPVIVTLMNGPVTFDATPITFNNPDFSAASNTCVGSVSSPTCQFTIRFIPSSLTNETGTATLHDDAPTGGSTQTVALIGTGVNYPTPSPAVQFVFNNTVPITMTVNGLTYTQNFKQVCTCAWQNPVWSCVCK